MARPRFALCLVLLAAAPLLAAGCKGHPKPKPKPKPPPLAPLLGPRPVATQAAFDLVATGEGGVLVWGVPTARGAGIRAIAIDPLGGPRGSERNAVAPGHAAGGGNAEDIPPDAVEIAAAAGGGRLGVVWVLRNQTVLRVQAALGDDSAEAFSPPEDLAPTRMDKVGVRGQVAAAASPAGELAVFYREGDGPCEDGQPGTCARLEQRRLGAKSGREGVPMVMHAPCDPPIVGDVFSGNSWYYAVCSEDTGRPETTLFLIQFEPAYAHAEQLLGGCVPRGLTPLDNAVAVTASCGDHLAGATLGNDRHVHGPEALHMAVRCADGRPVIEGRGMGGGMVMHLPLGAPTSRLAALLPSKMAPPGARAVWTGEALLVAVPVGQDVAFRRYQCKDGDLTRTDGP